MNLIGAILLGITVGAVGAGLLVWSAAKARWLEREAQINEERDRLAQLYRWREESVRREMGMDLPLIDSAASQARPASSLRLARGTP